MAITEFISGHWYVYKGTKKSNWNPEGKMDFMLDGMPHQCNKTDGVRHRASFYDSIDPDRFWSWDLDNEMKYFYDVSDEYKKDKLQEFLEV